MNLLFFWLLAALPPSSSTSPQYSESIVVSAIRADDETPVTKTDIPREEIEQQYHGQDVPLLLREAPSINTYTESGVGGSGYSYISLRGVSPTRINFTLDGVPLADSEDMGTYFADFPDLARSLESIQIQRGVGTSTFGSPSFGGSVNMESVSLAQDQKTSATLGVGSFGNRQASVGYQSGQLPNGLALYTRLSYLENDGFRDNSGIRQHNVFLSAAKNLGDAQLRLTGFSGHEDQQLAFYATDADTLKTDLRANPLRAGEKDSFGYDLAQLQYLRANMTASVYYQRGYGWYRLFDAGTDVLREYGLDGMLARHAAHVFENVRRAHDELRRASQSLPARSHARRSLHQHARLRELRRERGGQRVREGDVRPWLVASLRRRAAASHRVRLSRRRRHPVDLLDVFQSEDRRAL